MKLVARALVILALAGASSGMAQSRMAAFEEVSATGEIVEIQAPTWMAGKVSVDGVEVGSVRRRSLGRSEAVGIFGVRIADVTRYGRFSFTISGLTPGGSFKGDCIYDRTEGRLSFGPVTAAGPRVPLLLQCRFQQGEIEVGRLDLDAAPRTQALVQPSRRIGHVRFGGSTMEIASVHRLRGSPLPTDMPVGYLFMREGQTAGAIDLTQFSLRRAVVPRGSDRAAALAGALTLALFWDPGDTDD